MLGVRRAMLVALVVCTIMPWEARADVPADGRGDVTVIAVIDNGFSPYPWDFIASKMPQALDADPSNDLPLTTAPDTWLPGFPSPDSFWGYSRLDVTLATTSSKSVTSLDTADTTKWNTVRKSIPSAISYYWIPGTKIVGALTFSSTGKIHGPPATHGIGTSSVSVGNLHGACPECVVVLIQYDTVASGEAALEWAESQPWIDAISNSYGFSQVERERLYSGSNVGAQRAASERGQTIFFSAGNGISNTFTVPNSTYFSSQEGPDWIVTVGASAPADGSTYTGSGKPADVAGIGSGYPSAYGATTVSGSGAFGGTSNATPTIAGTYGRALYVARRNLGASSRIQDAGTIASGVPYACASVRAACELGDGVLTASELRARLLDDAVHSAAGMNPGDTAGVPAIGEDEFLGEGHGTYFVRVHGDGPWNAEFDARLAGPLEGRVDVPARPAGEPEWMIVDSYCRQHLWGTWAGGSYVDGVTSLPGPDPTFPVRSAIEESCPHLFPPV